jgi:hypothetical protein
MVQAKIMLGKMSENTDGLLSERHGTSKIDHRFLWLQIGFFSCPFESEKKINWTKRFLL